MVYYCLCKHLEDYCSYMTCWDFLVWCCSAIIAAVDIQFMIRYNTAGKKWKQFWVLDYVLYWSFCLLVFLFVDPISLLWVEDRKGSQRKDRGLALNCENLFMGMVLSFDKESKSIRVLHCVVRPSQLLYVVSCKRWWQCVHTANILAS